MQYQIDLHNNWDLTKILWQIIITIIDNISWSMLFVLTINAMYYINFCQWGILEENLYRAIYMMVGIFF